MITEKEFEVVRFTEKEFEVVRFWYSEWARLPRYLVTVSLAVLAFSLTTLLPSHGASNSDNQILRLSWLFLSCSTALASVGVLAAYCSLEMYARAHLADVMASLNMIEASTNTSWVSRFGKLSYLSTSIALVFLLMGSTSLVFFVVRAID